MRSTTYASRTSTASTTTRAGSLGFDWLVAILSTFFVGGLYLDGWAHIHVPDLETFFTPWHAVLYSGFLAVAAALIGVVVLNHRRGASWRTRLEMRFTSTCGEVTMRAACSTR